MSTSPVPPSPTFDPTASLVLLRVADRSKKACARFPEAVRLESDVVAKLHDALEGHATAFRGVHSGDVFRRKIRGQASMSVGDLCRLASSSAPRARDAAGAAVAVLAAACGLAVIPQPSAVLDAVAVCRAIQASLAAYVPKDGQKC